jgi:hypothetical protein
MPRVLAGGRLPVLVRTKPAAMHSAILSVGTNAGVSGHASKMQRLTLVNDFAGIETHGTLMDRLEASRALELQMGGSEQRSKWRRKTRG